jgi:transcriptional regulator with XRE-family HTH domain
VTGTAAYVLPAAVVPSSAVSAPKVPSRVTRVVLGVALLVPVTGAISIDPPQLLDATNAYAFGARPVSPDPLPQHVALLTDLEARSGLNRLQLAALLGVSRRSLYNWLDGERMSTARQRRARDIDALLAGLDASPGEIAAALTGSDGGIPILGLAAQGEPISLLAGHLAERLNRRSPLSRSPLRKVVSRRDGGTSRAELARLYSDDPGDGIGESDSLTQAQRRPGQADGRGR